jgi:hypothetical protein
MLPAQWPACADASPNDGDAEARGVRGSTSIVKPAERIGERFPGVHIAAASLGSELRSTSTTWAGRCRDGIVRVEHHASPGTP